MTRNLRISMISALLVLLAVSTFAQNNPDWRTNQGMSGALVGEVVDVDSGRGRLQIESDDSSKARITVETDSISTQFFGFGSIISGKPEIFTGSKGFSNARLGDRVEVRGSSRAGGIVQASSVTLVGREVAANPTGVGQTRSQTSVATPAQQRETTTTTAGTVNGTIRQINAAEGRIVIQTAARRMMTVRTYRNTPVVYRNQTYQVSNLEVGDEIRVVIDPNDAQFDEVSARRIEVLRSVSDNDTNRPGGVVTMLEGPVTRTEPGLDYAYVDDGRGEVRVDMSNAEDANGARIHARDVRAGDRVEIAGSFNRVGDMFLASTVRYAGGGSGSRVDVREPASYAVVTFTATVTETLEDAATLGLRDRDTNRTSRLWVTDDFLVRLKNNTTTTTAQTLRINDVVLVKAFRDLDGNLIAQTIRLRNR